jgi:asparagine synthase (glutamine-hydrolysing)
MYNHVELRRQLLAAGHHFKTDHSDTEVLLHGYEEWGIEFRGVAGQETSRVATS